VLALSVKTYLKDPLNRIDFLIVVCGVVDIAFTLADMPIIKRSLEPTSNTEIFGALRILRIVKTLRPMRFLLFRIQRVRIVVEAISGSFKQLRLAASITLVLIFILGVFSQQIFAGRMGLCSDRRIYLRSDCVGIDARGLVRRWGTTPLNCDWIGDSAVLIFTSLTKDRWREIIWSISDISGRDSGPYMDKSWYDAIVLLVGYILGSILTLNLLVSLFIESYTRVMITVRQKEYDTPACLKIKGRESLPIVIDRPRMRWRKTLLDVLEGTAMDRFFMLCFLAYLAVVSVDSYKSALWVTRAKEIVNPLISFIFGAVLCLKLVGWGPRKYLAHTSEHKRDYASAIVLLASEALSASIQQGPAPGTFGWYFSNANFVLLERLMGLARLRCSLSLSLSLFLSARFRCDCHFKGISSYVLKQALI
jgi:hypothetical protein